MSFAARQYQTDSITSLREGWEDPEVRNQLVVMATGCGKTVVFSLLAADEVTRGGRVLILAHTDELIDQAIDKFQRSTGLSAEKEKAGAYASRFARVVVGSVQTMQGDLRLSSWPKDHFSIIVVDEAHRSLARGYQKILNHFAQGSAKVVGVTATADRGDKKTLGEFFHRVAYDYGLIPAVKDGWLVRPLVKTMPVQIDLQGVTSTASSEGYDLDRKQVGHRLAPFMDKIAQAIRAEIASEKVLLFLPSVETAQIMSQALITAGISSNWVCGDKNLCPDRAERVKGHKRGDFQALTNMAVLTEGYDDDSIRNIACLRATKIRSLYAQIVGRGTRPLASIVPQLNAATSAAERVALIKNSAKPHIKILDFLWLYEKHDLCTPASLVTKDDRLAEMMVGKQGDLLEMEAQAEKDLLKKLEDEVRKNSRKKSVFVDPLALATDLGDVELATYQPVTDHEAKEPTAEQLRILANNGIRTEAVKNRGHASALIGKILDRHKAGLCTVRQLNFLKKIGIDASNWSKQRATEKQQEKIREWEARRKEKQKLDKERDAEVAEVARELNFDVSSTVQANRQARGSLLEPIPAVGLDDAVDDLDGLF